MSHDNHPQLGRAKSNVLEQLDENKASHAMDALSRVIAAYGVETMRNLVTLRVLVIGLRGVGIESAKNLVLARPAAVTVYDDSLVRIEDLGTNFYVNADHVGKTRLSDACLAALAELNPYVTVSAHSGPLDADFLHQFGAVVVTTGDLGRSELIRIDNICRAHKPAISFIYASSHGVTGTFFTDFGDDHVVTDKDGEPKRTTVIERIDSMTGRVKTVKPHGLDDGDYVQFSDVNGCFALNHAAKVKVKRIYSTVKAMRNGKEVTRSVQQFDVFQIDLESLNEGLAAAGKPTLAAFADMGEYKEGGIITEVKPELHLKFRSFEESLTNPVVDPQALGVLHPDDERYFPEAMGGKGIGNQLHFAFLSMLEFHARHGALPKLHDRADAKQMVDIAEEILNKHKALGDGKALIVEKINQDIVTKYSLYARAELPGYSAFLGGVAAQEVVKKFGKYTPHYQWMQSDHMELLDADVPADAAPIGSRYDHQISIFGKSIQDKISNEHWFLVGCGALGCEYLKGFALMGIGCGPNGLVHVTDMDRIELSNLSRQFLFRSHHIGKPKSVSGAAVAQQMNPSLNIKAYESKVDPSTEDTFTDKFWESLTGVWNALDNVHARRYTDQQCLLHSKPLMESGTMGTSANSEIVLPFLTKSYNDQKDQDVAGIAACTLRNFPHLIEHCIEWAKPEFSEFFQLGPDNVNKLLQNREAFFDQVRKEGNTAAQLETLRKVRAIFEKTKERTMENCIRLAFNHFNQQFRTRILDLIHFFPKDTRVIDKTTGADLGPFWSGAKRFPEPAEFDVNNQTHFHHIFNTANLYAVMFGLPPIRDEHAFKAQFLALALVTPAWTAPKAGPNMEGDETATTADKKGDDEPRDEDAELQEQFDFFRNVNVDELKNKLLISQEFEKDDDSNFHIDFITAASNLRAFNYRITPCTRHHCKVIAGKIIPALATTTAMVTGLVELEYYKMVKKLPVTAFFNSNPNLALGKYSFFAVPGPIKALERDVVVDEETKETKHIKPFPNGFTSWDHVIVDRGNLTVEEFVKAFPEIHHGVQVTMLMKHGITAKDIESKKAAPLFAGLDKRQVPAMALNMLKNPSLSAVAKAKFQAQVDEVEKYNAELEIRLKRKLIDLYTEMHGPLITAERNYVLLTGSFSAPDCDEAEVPLIKYIFKH